MRLKTLFIVAATALYSSNVLHCAQEDTRGYTVQVGLRLTQNGNLWNSTLTELNALSEKLENGYCHIGIPNLSSSKKEEQEKGFELLCTKCSTDEKLNKAIKHLVFRNVPLNDTMLISLCTAWLANNSSIQTLDLSFNDISDTGAAILANTLSQHPSITHVDLQNNYNITEDGLKKLVDIFIASKTLTILNVQKIMPPNTPFIETFKKELAKQKNYKLLLT